MSKTSNGKIKTAAFRAAEALEPRRLLTVTLTSPIANVDVAQDSSATVIDLNSHFTDPQVTGTTVVISTPNGNIPLELFDSTTPQTVQSFLNYVNAGLYNNTIIHRSVNNTSQGQGRFVIQGGAFDTSGNSIAAPFSSPSEANIPDNRGTIAMALGADQTTGQTDPNSATNSWFINEADNNFLDTTSNGPFTVFGQVIYNGMTIADAINDLPTVPANTLNANLPSDFPLPVENASGGTGVDNLVTVNASVQPHVTLTLGSDNPLVTPTLGANNQLSLVYSAGAAGIAHITVTGTDLGGNKTSQTFRVRVEPAVGNQTPVVVGAGGASFASYTQADGTAVTVSLKGPGSATLTFDGQVATTPKGKGVTISGINQDPDVAITRATAKTTLTFTAKGGGKYARIGNVTADSDLGAISGKSVNLDGDMTIAGSLKSLLLHGASNGLISLGTGAQALTLKSTTAFADELIHSAATVKSVTTPGFTGTSSQTSGIAAPAVGSISVAGSVVNSAFSFTAPNATDLTKLAVKADILNSTFDAVGNIGAVTAALMTNSHIFAGIAPLTNQALPNLPSDFATVSSIKSVKVTAGKTATFSNSNIAASLLGSIAIGRVASNNNGQSFGVAADKITLLSGTDDPSGKKFSLHKLDDPAALPDIESKLGFGLGDLVIKLF